MLCYTPYIPYGTNHRFEGFAGIVLYPSVGLTFIVFLFFLSVGDGRYMFDETMIGTSWPILWLRIYDGTFAGNSGTWKKTCWDLFHSL